MTILPAIRSLSREPGLVAGRVITLALAIGVTATMIDIVTRLMPFETSPLGAGVMAFAVATFAPVTIVAAAWPASRASRVSPTVALRANN